ncbi:tRNA-dihydrouridine synthase B [Platysternon megacephalum]|uniref:tRNA-dihydrouridine synthase B n=1 Tax=Platysternon megacephalum TaxID=55544 RepID=A0A4D9DES6_9SAUR|nr:tRNA-dihydrouridine synthase B [Platysternon megacephalum]
MEQFAEHIRSQELGSDRRGVKRKAFQSENPRLSGLPPRTDALRRGVAPQAVNGSRKGLSRHPLGMRTKATDSAGTNSGFARTGNYPLLCSQSPDKNHGVRFPTAPTPRAEKKTFVLSS